MFYIYQVEQLSVSRLVSCFGELQSKHYCRWNRRFCDPFVSRISHCRFWILGICRV